MPNSGDEEKRDRQKALFSRHRCAILRGERKSSADRAFAVWYAAFRDTLAAEVIRMQEKPSPKVLWSWVTVALAATFPLGALSWGLARYVGPTACGLFTALWVPGLVLTVWLYLPRRLRKCSYTLDEKGVRVTGGVFCITTRIMSIDAVRQVTLLQGPLERLCHTAFLLVSATGGYLLIEGIDQERAEEWRRRLISV